MNQLLMTRKEIVDELNILPLNVLPELQKFMAFLQFKSKKAESDNAEQSRRDAWNSALEATFGMWADRDDIAHDGVTYVQEIRRGHRLDDFLERTDENN